MNDDRRKFLQGVALAGAGLGAAPLIAQGNDMPGMNHGVPSAISCGPVTELPLDPVAMKMKHGMLGAAGAGAGRPKVGMLVHPGMVMQDLVGPLTLFNLSHCEIHLVWKDLRPVRTEIGLTVTPTTVLADCPRDLDVLFVPGGLEGTIAVMEDKEVIAFLADRGPRAKWVTSVCTGSLALGAAGLLKGYNATSLWATRDLLPLMGAKVTKGRVVRDRNRITGGGVTAGIDFGLTLVSLLKTEADAQWAQLAIEYAPQPPFNAGEPETAPKAVVDRFVNGRAPAVEQARVVAARMGKAMGV